MSFPEAMEVVDSHTEGEPTRVVVSGWPMPSGATMAARRQSLLATQDHLRQAVVCEPRGHDAMVGAVLTPPVEAGSATGVIFFDNAGGIGMCGHGLIGVVRTLEFLGRLRPGRVRLDTPVGGVAAELHPDGAVTIENVPAVCHALDVSLPVEGLGVVSGDIAWGGNWFFLTRLPEPALELRFLDRLVASTARIKRGLAEAGMTGAGGAEIDHVILFGPPTRSDADSRNFVLCPGLAYDRSPCGTGTSARMAALFARGSLAPGQLWRQESITGGLFTGWLEQRGSDLIPFVRGRAFVTGKATLFFDPRDPLRAGFTATR